MENKDKNHTSDERRENDRHLFTLRELDEYQVADNDPDVRGWSILDRDHKEFGKIDGLVVDPDKKKVRYLDVVPYGQSTADEVDLHLLVPVGVARIDDEHNNVIVDQIEKDQLKSYPMYRGDYISRENEYEIVERYGGPADRNRHSTASDSSFYEHELYDEDRFYTGRNKDKS